MVKSKRISIEVYPTEAEKQLIQARAQERGLSNSRYLIDLAITGREVRARRRTEGSLTNAELHWQLGQMIGALQGHISFSDKEKRSFFELIQAVRQEVTRSRRKGGA